MKQKNKKDFKETLLLIPLDKVKPLESDIQEFVDKNFWELT